MSQFSQCRTLRTQFISSLMWRNTQGTLQVRACAVHNTNKKKAKEKRKARVSAVFIIHFRMFNAHLSCVVCTHDFHSSTAFNLKRAKKKERRIPICIYGVGNKLICPATFSSWTFLRKNQIIIDISTYISGLNWKIVERKRISPKVFKFERRRKNEWIFFSREAAK